MLRIKSSIYLTGQVILSASGGPMYNDQNSFADINCTFFILNMTVTPAEKI
jgi:hypothetical protein